MGIRQLHFKGPDDEQFRRTLGDFVMRFLRRHGSSVLNPLNRGDGHGNYDELDPALFALDCQFSGTPALRRSEDASYGGSEFCFDILFGDQVAVQIVFRYEERLLGSQAQVLIFVQAPARRAACQADANFSPAWSYVASMRPDNFDELEVQGAQLAG